MAVDVQKEMMRRVTNGLTDLRHELAGVGVNVEFDIMEKPAGVLIGHHIVLYEDDGPEQTEVIVQSSGGVVEPGSFVAIGDDGPETIELSAGFKDTGVVPTLPAKKTKGG